MKSQRVWILAVILLLLATAPAQGRTWTDTTGKFSVEAELVEVKDGKAWLKKLNGKVVVVPIAKLAEADRNYIKSLENQSDDVNEISLAQNAIIAETAEKVEQIAAFQGHTAPIFALAFSPRSAMLASGSIDKTIRLWDLESRQQTALLAGHEAQVIAVEFDASGGTLASAGYDRTIRLWDVNTGRQTALQKNDPKNKSSVPNIGGNVFVTFSPDGNTLAYHMKSKGIFLWDVKTSSQRSLNLTTKTCHTGKMAFSPDGRMLAATVKQQDGSGTNIIQFWDLKNGKESFSLTGPAGAEYLGQGIAISPDGALLAVVDIGTVTIQLFDLKAGKATAMLKGHTLHGAYGVAFNADSSLVASAGYDKTVRLWDVKKGAQIVSLAGHNQGVSSVAFSRDGRFLASADLGGDVILWSASTREPADNEERQPFAGTEVSGKIHGQDFKPDRIELNNGILEIRQGKDFFADLEVSIFLFLDEGESLDGKTFTVMRKQKLGENVPHIHMKWKESEKRFPESDILMGGYAMNLEFGKAAGGKLPAKIDLRLPDKDKSFIKGSFIIVKPGVTTEPGTSEIAGSITVPTDSDGLDVSIRCLGRNPEGKLEGPGSSFSLDKPTASATSLSWKPRNSILKWNKKTRELTHKHINRPPGRYLIMIRGNRLVLPDDSIVHESIYDWKWVEIKDELSPVNGDLAIDLERLGTLVITRGESTKASKVTYLPLNENGELPFPDAHRYMQNTSSAEFVDGKAVIRGLREGMYQIAIPPWKPQPAAIVNVEVKRGGTTNVMIPDVDKP